MVESETKRIFVGGLGRSGTTILTQLLGRHSDIVAYHEETRFIVDANGLGELVCALSRDWAGPSTAGVKLQAFRQMMTHDLLNAATLPYEGYCLYDIFERSSYDSAVSEFLKDVIRTEWAATGMSNSRAHTILGDVGERRIKISIEDAYPTSVLPRYFDFHTIRGLAAELVDRIFLNPTGGKRVRNWAEKTPHNILSPYPRQIFPDCYIIHIIRDSRDVAASIADSHAWGPSRIRDAIDWVSEFYKRWSALRTAYVGDPRYIEVRYEKLVCDPSRTMREICSKLGLAYEPAMAAEPVRVDSIGRFRQDFNQRDLAYFKEAVVEPAREAAMDIGIDE